MSATELFVKKTLWKFTKVTFQSNRNKIIIFYIHAKRILFTKINLSYCLTFGHFKEILESNKSYA